VGVSVSACATRCRCVLARVRCVWLAAGYATAVAVPAMPAPPLGTTEKAEPATACVWSRFSDQVTVNVVPSAATVAELIVGAVVSTRKERMALKEELAAEESTFLARQ